MDVAVLIVYFVIGWGLERWAWQEIKDKDKLYTFTPMVQPDEYTEEGNRRRRIGNRYWLIGGLAWLLLGYWQGWL